MMVGWVAWRFPFAWPRHTPNAFPWLPVLVESLGAFAAFTINEGMPLALIWQGALGGIAVMSILWRIHSWRASRSTETTA
jgi:hypothetical protein